MSEEFFVIVNAAGQELWRSSGPPGDAARQVLDPGIRAIVIPRRALLYTPLNLAIVKAFYKAIVDQGAGEARAAYITDVPGQAQTYEKKEAEARRWQSGDDAADYPFLSAEATVRGVPIAQVQSEVMAQVNALTPLAALIEAHRRATSENISAATDLLGIVAAAQVDWPGLLA